MAQKFTIAYADKTAGFHWIGKKSPVEKELFYSILHAQVKMITSGNPEKFEEVLELSKEAVVGKQLTILDINFEIKGKE